MGKCRICGNSGLFLFVNSDNVCKTCEKELERKRNQEEIHLKECAIEYFNNLCNHFSLISSEIEDKSLEILDPVQVYEKSSSLIRDKMNKCTDLFNEIDEYTNYPYIADIILQNVTYSSEQNKRINYGELKSLSLSVWTGPTFSVEKVFNDFKSLVKKYENAWWKVFWRTRSNAEFHKTFLSLNCIDFIRNDSPSNKLNLRTMPELKLSSVTAKSNYEKLGTFIALDIETTGLNPSQNQIIEIAAIYFHNWIPMQAFHTLVNPECKLPANIIELTSIDDNMLSNAPVLSEVLGPLESFIQTHNIVGHNLPFDISFLYHNGLNFFAKKRNYYDTLDLSRKFVKDIDSYKLNSLCDYYAIRDNDNAHRALYDSLATGILFNKLLKEKITV